MSDATILHETVVGYRVHDNELDSPMLDLMGSVRIFLTFRAAYTAARRRKHDMRISVVLRTEVEPKRCQECGVTLIPVNTREWLRCSRCGE